VLSFFFLFCAADGISASQAPLVPPQPDDSILLLPASPQELGDRQQALRRVKERLRDDRDQPRRDLLVVFTDESGQAILPDSIAAQRTVHPGFPGHENDLSFTFDSPENPWTADDVAFLKQSLSAFYPVAKRIYGPPAFNITVNIRQDPTITVAGLYFVSTNEMIVRSATSATLDVLCHEMIHAFHDDNIIALASFEEGMARAVEVEVFAQLHQYVHPFDEAHGYEYDVYYEALNRPDIGAAGGNINDGYVSVLLRYQLAGYAWAKPLIENDQFFRRFNRIYYRLVSGDPTTRNTEAVLVAIAARAQHSVEGEPFAAWYSHQAVLNTAPPIGLALYQRVNQFTVDFFERTTTGFVAMIPDAPLGWRMFDADGTLLDAGTGVTAANGHLSIEPIIPVGYSGRLELDVIGTTTDGRTVENVTFRPFISGPVGEAGIFGVVRNYNEGTLTLEALDPPRLAVTVPVEQGVFSAPSLETVRGRFSARLYVGGVLVQERVFTKDASRYLVLF
jgi:hypothetical protein